MSPYDKVLERLRSLDVKPKAVEGFGLTMGCANQ